VNFAEPDLLCLVVAFGAIDESGVTNHLTSLAQSSSVYVVLRDGAFFDDF
jgi:hypothetical protein